MCLEFVTLCDNYDDCVSSDGEFEVIISLDENIDLCDGKSICSFASRISYIAS